MNMRAIGVSPQQAKLESLTVVSPVIHEQKNLTVRRRILELSGTQTHQQLLSETPVPWS